MTLQSSFKAGDRVQVVLPQINLEHDAGDEYPNMGIGTVAIPTRKVMVPVEPAKKAVVARSVIESDLKKFAVLQEQRQIWVRLDEPFLRGAREETPWRKREKARAVRELAIPEWLLKKI